MLNVKGINIKKNVVLLFSTISSPPETNLWEFLFSIIFKSLFFNSYLLLSYLPLLNFVIVFHFLLCPYIFELIISLTDTNFLISF